MTRPGICCPGGVDQTVTAPLFAAQSSWPGRKPQCNDLTLFLQDVTGTLDLSNEAGKVTAKELHRSILCAQQMLLSEVLDVPTWSKRL